MNSKKISKTLMKRPGFYKFFTSESSGTQMQIPMSFLTCIARVLPKKVFLRDRFYNMWCVKPEKVGEDWYFTKGWRRFIRDNALKDCEVIVFDYFEKDLFDFKILGPNKCETVGAGGFLYIADDVTDDDLNDVSSDDGEEDEEEECDDDDFSGGDDEANLSMRQKSQSKGDDDHRIDGGLSVKREPKSEGKEDNHGGGIYKNVRVKKEPKQERDDHGLFAKKEPKSGGGDDGRVGIYKYVYVKKDPKAEGDDSLLLKKGPKSEGDDDDRRGVYKNVRVKKEPEDEGDHGCADDIVENHDNNNAVPVKQVPEHEGNDGCHDEDLDHHADNDDDVENHGNDDDVRMKREPHHVGDNGRDEDPDDYAEDNDIENPSEADADASDHCGDDDEEVEDAAYHGGVDDKEIEDADMLISQEDEYEECEPKPANRAGKTRTKKRKRASVFPRYYGMEIFDLGLATRPTNPFFITHVSPRRKGDLFIPMELIKDHNLEMPKPELILIDPHGREFRGKYKKWKDGRTLYSKGWRTLWKVNAISLEDYCICEFCQGENGLYLKVSVVYVNGGPPICTPKAKDNEGKGDGE